jgi:hypothetical protein
MINRARGFIGTILIILLIVGALGLYFGYNWYNERYYVTLYDGDMVRYMDIPPFCERETPASGELTGKCVLNIGTSVDQASGFYKSMCNRYGYIYSTDNDKIKIEVHRNYIINGEFKGGKLYLNWQPKLNKELQKKLESKKEK